MSRWRIVVPAAALLLAGCAPAETAMPSSTVPSVHASTLPSAAPPSATAEASPTPEAAALEPITVANGDDALVGDALLLQDGVVVVGSLGGEPAVWTSTDGDTWQTQPVGRLGEAGHLAEASAVDGLVLAVGWRSVPVGGAMADEPLVVAGGQGGPWRAVSGLPLPTNVSAQLSGIAADRGRVVVGGVLSDGSLAAWVTTDSGVSWAGPNVLPSEPGSSIAGMAFAAGEFIAVGESIDLPSGPGVWRSPDGVAWRADHPSAGGGSLAALDTTERGPIAVGHDGEGHATVWSLSESPPALVEPPDVDDLYAIAPIAGSILVAAPNAPSTPVLLLTDNGWSSLRLAGAGTATLRAVAAANGQFVVAGDDGSAVKVWRGSLD